MSAFNLFKMEIRCSFLELAGLVGVTSGLIAAINASLGGKLTPPLILIYFGVLLFILSILSRKFKGASE
ncbi:hypothetical protein FTO70_03785 [Methanosarcina sp. KYL-1]|uniref:hypothetical protein n=1 Tax=Methanosarcina sp. KYL-1 TaxID=2602068 RepID=UPI0021014B90|nr:hypothetical protein [Methanosarcina sp. KYL-1]MCQ1534824.1 hypothetical protein [Methanosarcina sp. KYL-1]